jgi:hypothetical protein
MNKQNLSIEYFAKRIRRRCEAAARRTKNFSKRISEHNLAESLNKETIGKYQHAHCAI